MAINQQVKAWLITNQFGMPSEVWMYRQAQQMQQLKLTVFTHNYENQEAFPEDGFSVKMIEGRQKLPGNRYVSQALLQWWSLRNQFYGRYRGAVTEREWWSEQFKESLPDVGLAQFGTLAIEMLPLFEHWDVPLVAHFHGYDLSSALRRSRYRKKLAKVAHRFAACVVVAEYMREWLLEHGVPSEKIHKIPCGAPASEFAVSEHVGDQNCRCLAVGRMVGKKRPDLTIRAFAMAASMSPEPTLKMIGDGPMLSYCQRLTKELGIENQVEFLGSQPPTRVRTEMAKASLFVQHSVVGEDGDKEGWPVALAEAACAGLPIVSTRHASIPEQVEHGVTGLLCEENDWQTMGKNLMELVSASKKRVAMGNASRNKILPFDSKNQISKLQEVLLKSTHQKK